MNSQQWADQVGLELVDVFREREKRGIQSEMSEVEEGFLFLCGAGCVADSQEWIVEQRITHIVNMAGTEIKSKADGGVYPRKWLKEQGIELTEYECDDTDTWCQHNDAKQMLKEVAGLLVHQKTHTEPKKVIIHCSAGQSRSSAAVLAYLLYSNRNTLAENLVYLKQRRRFIYPGLGFLDALAAIEEEIRGSRTVTKVLLKDLHLNSESNVWLREQSIDDKLKGLMEMMGVSGDQEQEVVRLREALRSCDGDVERATLQLLGM